MSDFRVSFMHRNLGLDDKDLWYYAQKVAKYQNRPLFHEEVCAVIAYKKKIRPSNEPVDSYELFSIFDNEKDTNTLRHKARAKIEEEKLFNMVNDGLEEYLLTNDVARDRATAFAGIPVLPDFSGIAEEYKHWNKETPLQSYQHVLLYMIAMECEYTDGSALDDYARYLVAHICVMQIRAAEGYPHKMPRWITRQRDEYGTTMANYIEQHKIQFLVNAQELLDKYNTKLIAAGLKVCIIHKPTPEIVRTRTKVTEAPASAPVFSSSRQPDPHQSSGRSFPYGILNSPESGNVSQVTQSLEATSITATAPASSSGQTIPRFPHNILNSRSPSENPTEAEEVKGKEKQARERESDSGSPPEEGLSERQQGKRPRYSGNK